MVRFEIAKVVRKKTKKIDRQHVSNIYSLFVWHRNHGYT